MSLLSIIQEVCDLLSLTRPSAVINSNDTTYRQLYAIACEEAGVLAKMKWQAMARERTFVTVAAAEQPGAVPAGFKSFIPNTFFNRTTNRPLSGPVSPQVWQLRQTSPQSSGIILGYRQRDNSFLLTPNPPAGETIAFEYVSSYWAKAANDGADKAKWDLDTDETYLDESLIVKGIRWRWKAAKGFPYAEDHDSYTADRDQLFANDGGLSILSSADTCSDDLGGPIVPQMGYGNA